MTDFVVSAAIGEAERILGDRTRFVLDDAQWTEFVAMLDRPTRSPEGLGKLFETESTFDSPVGYRSPANRTEPSVREPSTAANPRSSSCGCLRRVEPGERGDLAVARRAARAIENYRSI